MPTLFHATFPARMGLNRSALRNSTQASSKLAAPQAPRSSISKRNAGTAARRSRQARRPARATAAGIVAASMARRCQNPSKKLRMFFSTRRDAGAGGWAGARKRRRDRRDAGGGRPRSASHGFERGRVARARWSSKRWGARGIRPCRPNSDARQDGEPSPSPTFRSPRQRPARSDNRLARSRTTQKAKPDPIPLQPDLALGKAAGSAK